MKIKLLIAAAALTFLSACAPSQSELAAKGDWQAIGYQDGIKGVTARNYQSLTDLGEANIAEYNQGYLEGIKEFCDPQFAYQIGLSGQYYEGVCEGLPEGQKFRMEWQRGWNESQ